MKLEAVGAPEAVRTLLRRNKFLAVDGNLTLAPRVAHAVAQTVHCFH